MQDPKTGSEPVSARERGAWWVVAQIILIAAIVIAPRKIGGLSLVLSEDQDALAVVFGVLITFLGVIVLALSTSNLGSNLTVFPRPPKDGSLVQTGAYSLVRHPIYCGLLLMTLGWSITRTNIYSLILTLVLAILLDRKAAHEEQWLLEKFPEYDEYRKRVRKLIPVGSIEFCVKIWS